MHSSQFSDPIDLTNVWLNFSIFENIERNYIEGEITITEAQDLFASIPIIGSEKIVIKFVTPSVPHPYVFVGQLADVPVPSVEPDVPAVPASVVTAPVEITILRIV